MKNCLKAIVLGGTLLTGGAILAQAEVAASSGTESFREVAQEDKAFLNKSAGATPPSIPATKPAPKSVAKPAPPKVVQEAKKSTPAKSTAPVVRKKQSAAPPSQRESQQLPRRITVTETRIGPPLISRDEVLDFVDDYLRSMESSSIEEEAAFYAERVQFSGKGVLSKERLVDAQARQREQWPDRSIRMESRPEIRYVREDEVVVSFRKSFQFENDDREMEGENVTQLHIKAFPTGPKIVAIEEK